MKPTLAALLALAWVAAATPAAACGAFVCSESELNDDSYPPGQPPLPRGVQEEVAARQGMGLSLAGFYNDPAVALQPREPVPVYGGHGYGRPYYGYRRRGHYAGYYARRREAMAHHRYIY